MKEQFKSLDFMGYPDYEISSKGRVYSLKSKIFLKPGKTIGGYPQVCLQNPLTGIKMRSVHRLVALAFIPNPENKDQVNHINGIKTDNRVENLEWCTCMENIHHAIKNGLYDNLLVIDVKQAHEICKRLENGMSMEDISKELQINVGIINQIKQRNVWKDVVNQYNIPKPKRIMTQYLVHAICTRLEKKMSVDDIAQSLKIPKNIVDAIRNGTIHKEISSKYSFGFDPPEQQQAVTNSTIK